MTADRCPAGPKDNAATNNAKNSLNDDTAKAYMHIVMANSRMDENEKYWQCFEE